MDTNDYYLNRFDDWMNEGKQFSLEVLARKLTEQQIYAFINLFTADTQVPKDYPAEVPENCADVDDHK